ncbi:MAG TPA: amino acid permease [Polyangia bacterium]|jgi:APA family basic amino acid/polyamine antiporter|nr:amino acid permease [Polyangia bacterium]
MGSFFKQLFATKSVEQLRREAERKEGALRPSLGGIHLVCLGIGAIIGTGIFVLTGVAAHERAGPALILSFLVAGLACSFAALCYSELASMAPVAGSAYTYAYASLGELFAWIIGWDLIIEYAVSAAAVAHGVSHYFQDLLGIFHVQLPEALTGAPIDYNPALGHLVSTGKLFDLPALLIVVAITCVLVVGIKESATLNMKLVLFKVAIVVFVIAVGAFYVNPANWHPFAPYGYGGINFFGKMLIGHGDAGGQPLGMLAGAAVIFFSYIGFDSVSAHSEEALEPYPDVPIGIISSLLICTVLYAGVGIVLTGMVPYDKINIDAPVSDAFRQVGLTWAQLLISLGAVVGITSVVLVTMLSQARILLAMARDGLLPRFFGDLHERFQTPWKGTILTGAFVGLLSSLLPLHVLSDLVNIGTLLAFVIVCMAVLILRYKRPDVPRPFRAPLGRLVALLGIATCLMLMFSLPVENWVRLGVWLLLGFVIYFGYGRRHSTLAGECANGTPSGQDAAERAQPAASG